MAVGWPSGGVEPGRNDNSVDDGRHKHTTVKTSPARMEALQPINGGKAGLGIACLPRFAWRRQVDQRGASGIG